jgi:SARP family transcriptional regulator, regulator of embCAB operon
MYVSVLGAVEIRGHGRVVRLNGVLQQTLLAALVVSEGRLLTVGALMDEMWGTAPPAKAVNALHAQVSRLRRALSRLEPDRAESRLTTSSAGYHLSLDRSEVDAWAFVDKLKAIRLRMEPDGYCAPDLATDLRDALALWRGPVFAGLVGGPLCRAAAARYTESRNAALSLLYEVEIKCGRSAEVLPELTELFAQNPSQERFCVLLMIALCRSGRQIDALDVYQRFQRHLAENFGIEPAPGLRELEHAIQMYDSLLMVDFPGAELPLTVVRLGGNIFPSP